MWRFRYDNASMDKNDTIDFLGGACMLKATPTCGAGNYAECETSAGLRLPGRDVQKMISGKYKLRIVWDLKDGPRRLRRDQDRLLRARTARGNSRARAQPRVEGAHRIGIARSQGLRRGPAEGGVSPDPQGQEFRAGDLSHRSWGTRHLAQEGSDVQVTSPRLRLFRFTHLGASGRHRT